MAMIHALSSEKGTTLIEAAAILPILFWLTFATIDIGRYFYIASTIHMAAQEGVRVGVGQDGIPNLADAVDVVQETVAALDATDVTIQVGQPSIETVEVSVSYRFEFITPFLIALFPDNELEINGSASMSIF